MKIPSVRVSTTSTFRLAALIVPLILASSAIATPISGSMDVGVEATAYSGTGTPTATGPDSNTASWASTPAGLSVAATSTATSGGGTTVNGYANGSATWAADGNSGTATFNYGWSAIDGGDYALTSVQTNLDSPNWSYTFIADATGVFTMNYNITAPGGLPSFGGLQQFYIGSDGGSTLVLDNIASGIYTQAVTAGVTYNVAFQNGGNVFDEVLPYSAGVQASFSWTLPGGALPIGGGDTNSVPDLGSTVCLMLLALAGLAAIGKPLKTAQ
ncbi:MAG: hypothetical protein ABI273_07705 [Lacunisphaera sp.]